MTKRLPLVSLIGLSLLLNACCLPTPITDQDPAITLFKGHVIVEKCEQGRFEWLASKFYTDNFCPNRQRVKPVNHKLFRKMPVDK